MSTYNSDSDAQRAAHRDTELIAARIKQERREQRSLMAMRLGGILLILVVWEGLVATGLVRELLVGQPSRIAKFLAVTFTGGELLTHTLVTGFEVLCGYLAGVSLGCTLGISMWWVPRIGKIFEPYMIGITSIPMVAIAPLFLVWFGLGIPTKIALSFVPVFLITYVSTYSSLRQVESELVDLATAFGASPLQIFLKIVVPSTLPWVFSTMKVCLGFAFTGAVIGEYVAANKGLGYLTLYAAQLYEMSLVWAAIVMLVFMSMCFYASISWLQRRCVPWQSK